MNETDPFAALPDDGVGDPVEEARAFPWPAPEGMSTLEALGQTWSGVVLHPRRFFSLMPIEGPLSPPVVFQLLIAVAAAGANTFWRTILPFPGSFGMTESAPSDPLVVFLLSAPIALALTVLGAGLIHIGLIVLGARRHGPAATLRILLFTSATSLFALVPWIGVWIGAVWGLAIAVIGIREVHGTSTGRATAAVLAPILGCATLMVMFVMLVVVLGLATGVMSR